MRNGLDRGIVLPTMPYVSGLFNSKYVIVLLKRPTKREHAHRAIRARRDDRRVRDNLHLKRVQTRSIRSGLTGRPHWSGYAGSPERYIPSHSATFSRSK